MRANRQAQRTALTGEVLARTSPRACRRYRDISAEMAVSLRYRINRRRFAACDSARRPEQNAQRLVRKDAK